MSAFILTVFKLLGSIVSGGLLFQAFVSSNHSKPLTTIAGICVSLLTLSMFVIDIKEVIPDDEADKTEQIYWESVEKHPSPASYRAYLNQYPEGKFLTLARTQIANYVKAMPVDKVQQIPLPLKKTETSLLIENENIENKDEAQKASSLKVTPAQISHEHWQVIAHYRVNDGLVEDTHTHLLWMRCSLGQNWQGSGCHGKATGYTWEQAINTPKQINYAGYHDWRLPTLKELKTLVHCSTGKTLSLKAKRLDACAGDYTSPTIVSAAFPETPAWFWSSSPYANSHSYAWYVFFGYGYDDWSYKYNDYHVRLVRNQ